MRNLDPLFLTPRPIARDWGMINPGVWSTARADGAPVGEIWSVSPDARTDGGESLGDAIRQAPRPMLGDAGRAPPKLRLVLAGADVRLAPTAPTSLWCIIQRQANWPILDVHLAGPAARADASSAFEASALVEMPGGAIAVEASSTFQPTNLPVSVAPVLELPSGLASVRSTLMRRPALSVEAWRLPDASRIEPDGETCHVLLALSRGVHVDGRELKPGQAVFVPAEGRPFEMTGAGGRLLTAYPDRAPTQIWRHASGPDPAGGAALRPAPGHPPAADATAVRPDLNAWECAA